MGSVEKDILLYNIGINHLELNDYEKCIHYVKRAISYNRKSSYFYCLGYCYIKKEDYGSALFNFIISLELDESNSNSKNAIELITRAIKDGDIKSE